MSGEKAPADVAVGCIVYGLTILIQTPLFCALMYGVIEASDAPRWVHVIFWIYLPVGILLGFARGMIEAVTKK